VSPGHCRRCGESSAACCCGCRECRREAKEVLVTPAAGQGDTGQTGTLAGKLGNQAAATGQPITPEAFIGGGCCVSLSVEYAPQTPTAGFGVEIGVVDSDGTTMVWIRTEQAGAGYKIKEGIITTKPGAQLYVVAGNCTARVRWCEVFSC
jgi:hypothetical protein